MNKIFSSQQEISLRNRELELFLANRHIAAVRESLVAACRLESSRRLSEIAEILSGFEQEIRENQDSVQARLALFGDHQNNKRRDRKNEKISKQTGSTF